MSSRSEKLKQNSLTEVIRPEVSLISTPNDVVGVIFSIWTGTRHSEYVNPEDIQSLYDNPTNLLNPDLKPQCGAIERWQKVARLICDWYPEYAGESGDDYKNVIKETVQKVLEVNVPVTESVMLNFKVENANVAWREQLVRGRHSQQYWITSSRTTDLSTMDVTMADSVRILGGEKAVEAYKKCVDVIRDTYLYLVDECGVPMEDIRLQPQSHVERDYWMVTLRTLISILNKRSDWIAQATLWTPVLSGVIQELRRINLYEIVEPFIGKPMVEIDYSTDFDTYYVSRHTMEIENDDRYSGRDKIPCDPLWLSYKGYTMPEHTDIEFYDYMKSLFINIWRDEYLQILGWDRENPEKIGPYDRPRSWFVSNDRENEIIGLE